MPRFLFLVLLLSLVPCGDGQAPQPSPAPPFHLNLQVIYNGEKEHPELAAFIYKALRELPGVGLVNREPDAVLIINEMVRGNQYGCTFTVLVPANDEVKTAVDFALSMYEGNESAREAVGETTAKTSQIKSSWHKWLREDVRKMQPMYHYGGGLMMLDPSPKVALGTAIKSLGATYVEKEHREYDYSVAHPVVLPPVNPPPPIYDSTPSPAPKRTPPPWNPPTMAPSQQFQLTSPRASATPFPLIGEDPSFPARP